jgi:hypothetical protein
VGKYFKKDYGANFISPFSANNSILQVSVLNEKSGMQDAITLFELDVIAKLKTSPAYVSAF